MDSPTGMGAKPTQRNHALAEAPRPAAPAESIPIQGVRASPQVRSQSVSRIVARPKPLLPLPLGYMSPSLLSMTPPMLIHPVAPSPAEFLERPTDFSA